jgi:DNA replication protein DnaC
MIGQAKIESYCRELGYEEIPAFDERDAEVFLRHRELCRNCPGLETCKEHGCVMQIFLTADKKSARMGMGYCTKRKIRDIQRKSAKLCLEAAIPPALRECRLENYVTAGRDESLQRAQSEATRASQTASSLVLAGGVGTGKSHLAAAIVHSALAQGRSALFISAIGYLERLKSTFEQKRTDLYMKMVDHVKSVDCLVIDDLGAEKPSAWTIERLYDVINARIEREAQTIVTTNFFDPRALVRRLEADTEGGKRIVSRLIFFGWLRMNGEDYRIMLRKRH